MNKDRENILLPVGRLIEGSLYTFTTHDMNGEPRIYKSGPKQGQPKPEFFFSLAIKKMGEQSWAQTPWGQQIYALAVRAFPRGEYQSPAFSWKIVDGDSTIPNEKGMKPCDRQGYAGCWVVRLKTTFAPGLINRDTGLKLDLPDGAIQLGDYIQPIAEVMRNSEKSHKPGIYITPKYVAFCGYGERIQLGINPQQVQWSRELPTGASATPVGISPTVSAPISPVVTQPIGVTLNNTSPPPYPQILTPVVPRPIEQQPMPRLPDERLSQHMKKQGFTFLKLLGMGYTEQGLISEGLMSAE